MQKWIGFVLVSVAVLVLIGCGKENNSGNAVKAPAVESSAGATTDNEKKGGDPGGFSEFVGTYTAKNSSKVYDFSVSVEVEISLTASQLVITKTCTRAEYSSYNESSQVAQASAQIEVIDRNHFKLAEAITRSSILTIPKRYYRDISEDVECGFKFPVGTYVLDFIGNELVLGGPSGLVARYPKR